MTSAAEQTELPLSTTSKVDPEDVARFVRFLEDQEDWRTARYICDNLPGATERSLRLWANASEGQILSGQRGYRHYRLATVEEIKHAAAWLLHQAKEMDARARAILRRAHQNL